MSSSVVTSWDRRHDRDHRIHRGCVHVIFNLWGQAGTLDHPSVKSDVRRTIEEDGFVGWIDACILDGGHKGPHHSQSCGEWFAKDSDYDYGPEVEFPYVYRWGNNEVRAALKGLRCKVLVRSSRMRSALIEFEDGTRIISDEYAIKLVKT